MKKNDFERYSEYGDFSPGPSKEIMGVFLEDAMNREAGKVAPDPAGADYFFLKGFVNELMEDDFAEIEKDFLQHCSDKMAEYYNAAWYGGDMTYDSSPRESVRIRILVMIFNGAKLGDPYCRELIRYLYKTYHKREYNQLKRFKTIDMQEIFSLTEDEDGGCGYEDMGRVIGMCCFMGIRLSEECSLLYTMLNRERDTWERENQEQLEFGEFRKGLLEECMQTVDGWWDTAQEKKSKSFPNEKYWEDGRFADICFRYFGYPEEYAYACREENDGLRVDLSRTLALLKTVYPQREFSYEEVQGYAHIYTLIDALTQTGICFDEQIDQLLGVADYRAADEENSLFKPENIVFSEKKKQEKAQRSEPVNVAPVSMGKAETEDYLAEIAQLRKKLHEKEQENTYLREEYRSAKKAEKDARELINKLQSDREELIALRQYAYHSALDPELSEETGTEEIGAGKTGIEKIGAGKTGIEKIGADKTGIGKIGIEEMQVAIAEKAVVIIGGHVNWIQKLRQLFPGWLFVHPDTYKSVDGKMLENKDQVYFFTDYLNHVSYVKFIAVLREKRIPFGYLGRVNVESVVRRVYGDLVTQKKSGQ